MKKLFIPIALLAQSSSLFAAQTIDLQACVGVAQAEARLECFDRLAHQSLTAQAADSVTPTDTSLAEVAEQARNNVPRTEPFADPVEHAAATTSPMQARWELTPDSDKGTFGLRPYQQNYAVLKLTSRSNQHPFTPLATDAEDGQHTMDDHELQFQLSFKTKLFDNLLGSNSDIWLGYTQRSNWQIFNGSVSRPFRETNYQPELMWVTPLTSRIGPLDLRYVSAGIVHQSNGRSDPLSRSWDRLFIEMGAEADNFAFTFRPWWRLPESSERDDNPDIHRYIGRGELVASYRHNDHLYAVQVRNNFSFKNNRGSVMADWSFPLAGELRGYARLFSGYGESLIDYNWRQTTFGIGIILTDRL